MTTTLTNISPQGDLELPLIGRIILAGETIEVSAEVGRLLDGQDGTWLVADSDPTIEDLRQIAAHRQPPVDLTGLRKKSDILAAIAAASTPPSIPPELGEDPTTSTGEAPAPSADEAPADPGTEPSQGDTPPESSGDDTDPEEGNQ